MSPATIVGSANGRSITELTSRLPGNWSRTSTHATSVPITAPIAAITSDATTVTASAVSTSLVVIESQKAPSPWENAFATIAASGISTITLM